MSEEINYEKEMNRKIEEYEEEVTEQEIREAMKPHFDLMDFVTTITEIRCDGCNTIAKSYMDEWEAIDEFLDKGWGVKKDKCYCEKCLEKKDKK